MCFIYIYINIAETWGTWVMGKVLHWFSQPALQHQCQWPHPGCGGCDENAWWQLRPGRQMGENALLCLHRAVKPLPPTARRRQRQPVFLRQDGKSPGSPPNLLKCKCQSKGQINPGVSEFRDSESPSSGPPSLWNECVQGESHPVSLAPGALAGNCLAVTFQPLREIKQGLLSFQFQWEQVTRQKAPVLILKVYGKKNVSSKSKDKHSNILVFFCRRFLVSGARAFLQEHWEIQRVLFPCSKVSGHRYFAS